MLKSVIQTFPAATPAIEIQPCRSTSRRAEMQLQQLPSTLGAIRGSNLLPPFWSARKSRISPPSKIVTCSSLEEDAQIELDSSKAKEALRQLDEQLQGLSETNNRSPPSAPPLESYLDRDLITGDGARELPELSPSFVAYTVVALVILTIFNNVMFNLYIKPSVDGNEEPIKLERVPLTEPTKEQFP